MTTTIGPVTIESTAAGAPLLFRSMRAKEELGTPFRYDLELLSPDFHVQPGALLGQLLTVKLQLEDDTIRFFSGYVTDFSMPGSRGRLANYRCTLRPWIWFLSQTTNCRIFQNVTVPDLIKSVFSAHGFTDFEELLTEQYPRREYIVQYRETDLNFVSRLMEQSGIYYYFKHEANRHVLVLADSLSSHSRAPGCERVPFYPPDPNRPHAQDHVFSWAFSQHVTPGVYAHTDYDFRKPRANLLTRANSAGAYPFGQFEVYDYPGEYESPPDGETFARKRLEELQATSGMVRGEGNVRRLEVGRLFELIEHPRDEQNREYLIVSGQYELRTHEHESNGSDQEDFFYCQFTATDSAQPFRPPRRTPRSVVRGTQTATVTGPAGEEIWCDSQARVKVKFHWDRAEAADENSSCWVRVAQAWAGSGWGSIHIPRIGQEVVVDFLEGDPDRPIIIGRVYNELNRPPYPLPGSQTQSGIKSHSTKGGSANNFNELRFEDKKGDEQVYLQAEKNLDVLVKNDATKLVQRDQHARIDRHDVLDVGANRTETVGGTRTETVQKAETITLNDQRSTTIAKSDTLAIGTTQSITVGASRSVTVAASEAIAIGGSRTTDVAKNDSTSVAGNRSTQIGKNEDVSIQGGRTQSVGKNDALQVTQKLELVAGEEITIKSGQSVIIMKKNGDITIKGKNITLDGSGKIQIKAASNVVVKGSKIAQN